MPEKTQKELIISLVNGQTAQNKNIEEIRACLLGDEYHPDGGLVNKVSHNSNCIKGIKKKQNKFFAVIGGVWAFFTIGLSLLINYLKG